MAFNDGREKSIGTMMRLNRRGRDAVVRGRGFRLSRVEIGWSSKLFMPRCCNSQERFAPRELPKARHFLAA